MSNSTYARPARAEPGTAYPPPAGATWAQVTAWQGMALEAGYCPFCGAALAHEAALVRCPRCGGTMVLLGEGE